MRKGVLKSLYLDIELFEAIKTIANESERSFNRALNILLREAINNQENRTNSEKEN